MHARAHLSAFSKVYGNCRGVSMPKASTEDGSADSKINRAGRQQCYQARDAFYQCVKECGVLYSSKTPIPSKCKQLRAKFESACLQSWVKHFDELQEAKARAVKNLHNAINTKAATAAGNLAGASQQ